MALPKRKLPPRPSESGEPASISGWKRERISKAKRKRALDLTQQLMFLQDKFTEAEFSEILQEAIDRAKRISESNRSKDRDLVFLAIDEQGCWVIEDICDQTGLSRAVVEPILDELLRIPLIKQEKEFNQSEGGRGGKPRMLYKPYHTPAGSDFTMCYGPGRSFEADED
ncbi:MAG TPA: hypothetical protein VF735_06670 [Pyrinomonadaceae bacterium]|jgi:hypothetical protein